MDSGVLEILGLLLVFIVLDVAALRFGHDSRGRAREMPLAGDVTITRPRLPTIRIWSRATEASQASAGRRSAAVPIQTAKTKPFRPLIPRDVLCFERLDLAAVGK